jgi:hypothetical protein
MEFIQLAFETYNPLEMQKQIMAVLPSVVRAAGIYI